MLLLRKKDHQRVQNFVNPKPFQIWERFRVDVCQNFTNRKQMIVKTNQRTDHADNLRAKNIETDLRERDVRLLIALH